jgi:hypothetical protein
MGSPALKPHEPLLEISCSWYSSRGLATAVECLRISNLRFHHDLMCVTAGASSVPFAWNRPPVLIFIGNPTVAPTETRSALVVHPLIPRTSRGHQNLRAIETEGRKSDLSRTEEGQLNGSGRAILENGCGLDTSQPWHHFTRMVQAGQGLKRRKAGLCRDRLRGRVRVLCLAARCITSRGTERAVRATAGDFDYGSCLGNSTADTDMQREDNPQQCDDALLHGIQANPSW